MTISYFLFFLTETIYRWLKGIVEPEVQSYLWHISNDRSSTMGLQARDRNKHPQMEAQRQT